MTFHSLLSGYFEINVVISTNFKRMQNASNDTSWSLEIPYFATECSIKLNFTDGASPVNSGTKGRSTLHLYKRKEGS